MPSSIDIGTPVALQGVPAPGYSALDLRRLVSVGIPQEGVLDSGDFKVTPAGAANQLSVAAGEAIIEGDAVSDQGRYHGRSSAAQTLTLATAPDVVNPRIDQVVLEVKDSQHDGSGLNVARLRVVSGTATVGATLANRSGAAALPSTCVRLADVLVPANYNAVFVAATHIRDRRPWARGAYRRIVRNQNAAAGTDYTRAASGTAPTAIDSTNLSPRIECSGAPLRCKLSGVSFMDSNTGSYIYGLSFASDGVIQDSTGVTVLGQTYVRPSQIAAGFEDTLSFEYTILPTAGSHIIAPYWGPLAGTATLQARASVPVQFTVEELVRQNADNT